jgi:glucuronate isomerase
MPYIHDDFLLRTRWARRLYHEFAEAEPILDYHCHLSPGDIAQNRRFENLFEIWLAGDHYKWRAMRANGVEERYITGDADPYEKFLAWARTVPYTLRNPLYHWTHLELKRYFGIDTILDEKSAPEVWERANAALASDDLSVHGILRRFRVAALCTTDDPTDDLSHHKALAASDLQTAVYPAFRPDKVFQVGAPQRWNAWLARLEAAANRDIRTLRDLLEALAARHAYFHSLGCRVSDHGLECCPAEFGDEFEAAAIFDQTRAGRPASPREQARFQAYLLVFLARLDAEKGWTKQLHLGARRDASTRMLAQVGPDTGFDSIGDWPQVQSLIGLLDRLDHHDALPKMILYNLNPADNYAFATAAGNFQGGGIPGRIQFGSGWWFLDQKEAMEWQLNALSNCGLLARFVGVVTDSRSFMSYPRHEYFRRVLSNLIGAEVEQGELPEDAELLGRLIRDVCYGNAERFFALPRLASPASG